MKRKRHVPIHIHSRLVTFTEGEERCLLWFSLKWIIRKPAGICMLLCETTVKEF